jgi:AhpD family alkylhydroperoxidase
MGNISATTDTLFAPLTVATAPEASRPMLEKVQKSLGFLPNLMAIFANNATVLAGYLALGAVFERGSFTPRERQIILLAASVENNCNYCAAAHSQIAKALLRNPAEVIAAVQNNMPVPDAKLNALVNLVKELVRERCYAKEKTIQKFFAAGLQKGIGDGASAGYRAEDDQELPRPHFLRRRLTKPWQARASKRQEKLTLFSFERSKS